MEPSPVLKPLFPAYPSALSTTAEERKDQWLYNTSFTESVLKHIPEAINVKEEETSSAATDELHKNDKRSIKKKEKKRKKHKSSYDKKETSDGVILHESKSVLGQLKKKTFIGETGLSYERAFRTDSRPDTENLMFEHFEKTKIAKYHTRLKHPAGVSEEEISALTFPTKEKVVDRYFNRNFLKLLKKLNTQVLITKESSLSDQCLEYIPISHSATDLSASKETDKITTTLPTTENGEKVIFYNKSLSNDSGNIKLWLEFIEFQDQLSFEAGIHSEKHIIEKKLSITEKALKYNPKDIDLNIMRLKLCQNTKSTEELTAMWNDLLFFNSNNTQVWKNYLLFFISNLTTFNCSSIQKLYARCLSNLTNSNHSYVESMLGIFDQLCCILRSCGYLERGIALYQALVEYNLFSDPSVPYFEPFWDSGAARVGEKGALGWAETMLQKKAFFDDQMSTELQAMEDEILARNLTLSETWLEFERLRETHHWLPSRPHTCDDEDRSVSFDDISGFLFSVPDERNRFLMVTNFVSYLGFNLHCSCDSSPRDIFSIDSAVWEELKLLNNPICFDICIWNEERYNLIHNVLLQVCDKFSHTYQKLLYYLWIRFQKFYSLKILKNSGKSGLKKMKKFVRGILQQPSHRNSLLLWTEYLKIEWLSDGHSSTDTFRTLLQSSVLAENVDLNDIMYMVQQFIDLTGMSEDSISLDEIRWILLQVSQQQEFVPYSNQEISPTMILRTVSALKIILTKLINDACDVGLCFCLDPSSYKIVSCVKCLAYFQYFSKNYDATWQVYEVATSLVEESSMDTNLKSLIKEKLCVAKVELLNHHTWHSSRNESMRPLQKFLSESVQIYPTNRTLLSLLLRTKSASALISPTRRLLSDILRDHPNAVTWLFALTAEFALCQTLFSQQSDHHTLGEYLSSHGINWRIRSLYEKMLQSEICGHNPILWRSYLKFEMMTHNVEKAESIFHRALQNCSWSKNLLMDGVSYFPEQLKQIVALMEEKQIRLHTPIEEVILLKEHAAS